MKCIYFIRYEIKTNKYDWFNLGYSNWCYKESAEIQSEEIIQPINFPALRHLANSGKIEGVSNYDTFFKKTPYVQIYDIFRDTKEIINEKNFAEKQIQFRITRKKYQPTMNWLIDHLDAEDFIQYMTDRGGAALIGEVVKHG